MEQISLQAAPEENQEGSQHLQQCSERQVESDIIYKGLYNLRKTPVTSDLALCCFIISAPLIHRIHTVNTELASRQDT